MDSTRQHLLRVSDIIGEIEGRLRSLRLQAQKAERYKRYKAELKDLELWSSAQRYLGHLAEEKSLGEELEDVRESHEARERRRWRPGEAAVEAERLAVTEESTELGDGQGRAVRAVEQGAAGHAARRSPRRGGRGARRRVERRPQGDRGAARAGGRAGGEHRGDRRHAWPRSSGGADGSEREYEEQARLQDERRAALAEARRELEAAQARDRRPARASIARREAERAGGVQRRDDLAARSRRRRRGDARPPSGWTRSSARSAALRDEI